jgi:branched-chain amino acid transport system permease protein
VSDVSIESAGEIERVAPTSDVDVVDTAAVAKRGRWKLAIKVLVVLAAFVLLLSLPAMLNNYRLFLASLVLVFATAGVGLTVIMGWTGQIVLAHAAFLGIGAYGTQYLFDKGVPWAFAAILSALFAAVVGVLIAFPASRLQGFYLAIATLAFAELILRGFIEFEGLTGGIAGTGVEQITMFGLDRGAGQYYLALVVASVIFVLVARVGRSSLGRCLRAVRSAEIATPALAISAMKYKLIGFGISAFIGAMSGAVFGQLLTYLSPDIFRTNLLIQFLVVTFFGGVQSLVGAVIGAIYVVVSREVLQDLGNLQRLAYGVSLILVVRFLPKGFVSLPSVLRARFRRGAPDRVET